MSFTPGDKAVVDAAIFVACNGGSNAEIRFSIALGPGNVDGCFDYLNLLIAENNAARLAYESEV